LFSEPYKRYVLAALTLVYTLNYVDRGLIILLLEPIKIDLHLSDTQLGFLTGIAFGLFYALLGVPLARLADRGDRVTLTSLAIALWGVTVMACVAVTNFVQLVFARIAAAVGEAGCVPPTYSLLGDYFPKSAERTRAMSIYWLASPISTLLSFIAGGWLNERYGWRVTFLIMGIPALVVALAFRLTVKEPRTQAARPTVPPAVPFGDVLRQLWRRESSRSLSLAIILLFTMSLGLAPWYASFMMRSHSMETVELGLWLGLIFGVGGGAGIAAGGFIVSRFFAGNDPRQMQICAVLMAALLPCFGLFLLLPHRYAALGALVPLVVLLGFSFGPAFALLQRLVPDKMRATTLALVMLMANLIGMGLGPQLVGILSDLMTPALGSDSLRYAMLAMSCVSLGAALYFWRVARFVDRDLAEVRSATPAAQKIEHAVTDV